MKNNIKKKIYYGVENDTFLEVKVVSRNIITDWVQSIRNLLGLELKSYTNIIKETSEELLNKVKKKPIDWFKVDIEEVARGGFLITVYGVYKR